MDSSVQAFSVHKELDCQLGSNNDSWLAEILDCKQTETSSNLDFPSGTQLMDYKFLVIYKYLNLNFWILQILSTLFNMLGKPLS